MNKKIIFEIIRKFNYLIWLLLLIFFTVFVTYFYDLNFHAPNIDIIANTGINIAIKITLS